MCVGESRRQSARRDTKAVSDDRRGNSPLVLPYGAAGVSSPFTSAVGAESTAQAADNAVSVVSIVADSSVYVELSCPCIVLSTLPKASIKVLTAASIAAWFYVLTFSFFASSGKASRIAPTSYNGP